jgi:hypothetical protein
MESQFTAASKFNPAFRQKTSTMRCIAEIFGLIQNQIWQRLVKSYSWRQL